MAKSLQSRKRQLVRDAIYDAAIELFAKRGFDETTVEEVAEAAGISRRSFFRYFETKDDLLALNTVHCGEILCQTVASCPAGLSPLELVRETVLAGVKFTEAQPHSRQIIEIAQRSTSARQAHLSRLMDIHDRLAAAFSARMAGASRYYLGPYLLAGMSQLVINAATASFFVGEQKDLHTAAKDAFLNLARVICDKSAASAGVEAVPGSKTPVSSVPKKSRNTTKKK
jgi:AcrR family transcriptional regulator